MVRVNVGVRVTVGAVVSFVVVMVNDCWSMVVEATRVGTNGVPEGVR